MTPSVAPRILAFHGSPRRDGNSSVLLEAAVAGARDAGCTVEVIHLATLRFRPCQNCGGCSKTGRCVLDDDLTPLYDGIDAACAVIIASPIYFYGVSAQTKAFIDRMQAFWSRKHLLGGRGAPAPGRPAAFLSVAATSGPRIFDGARLEVRYALDAMGFTYTDEVLVRGVDERGAMAARVEELQAAAALGRRLCRTCMAEICG